APPHRRGARGAGTHARRPDDHASAAALAGSAPPGGEAHQRRILAVMVFRRRLDVFPFSMTPHIARIAVVVAPAASGRCVFVCRMFRFDSVMMLGSVVMRLLCRVVLNRMCFLRLGMFCVARMACLDVHFSTLIVIVGGVNHCINWKR